MFRRSAFSMAAVFAFSSCAHVTEFNIRELKATTNFDHEDFDIDVFFLGCLSKSGSSCSGDLAVAFSSENLGYEKLVFDTVSLAVGDSAHLFVEGSTAVDLELRENKKYRHHYFGEVSLTRSVPVNLKLRGYVTRSDSTSRFISADIEYSIKKESSPVWLE